MARSRHARVLVVLALAALTAPAFTAPAIAAPASDPGTVVTGRVTNAVGRPLGDVVVLFVDDVTAPAPVATPVTSTASDGTYRVLRRVVDGPTELAFDGRTASDHSSGGYVPDFLHDPAAPELARTVTPVAGGRVPGADIELVAGAAITGLVDDADGNHLANVAVAVGTGDRTSRLVPPDVTDSRGRYVARGISTDGADSSRAPVLFLPAGATGGSSATGYPDTCLGGVQPPCDPSYQHGTPLRSIALRQGGITSQVGIVLPPAAVVSGRLTDSLGRGIGGVPVDVYGRVADPVTDVGIPSGAAISDPSGRWHASRVFPGRSTLCFGFGSFVVGQGSPNRQGYIPECWQDVSYQVGTGGGTHVGVGAGRVLNGFDAVLVGDGAVTGRVVDAQGRPVKGAFVQVGRDDDAGAVHYRAPTAVTGADGTYRIGRAEPGQQPICASAPGFVDVCPYPFPPTTVAVAEFTPTAAPDLVLHRRTTG